MIVRAAVAALVLSLGVTASPAQALQPAPTVTPQWTTADRARVDWTAVGGPTAYYRVLYATNPGFTGGVKKVTAARTIVLTSLQASTTYHVKVMAINVNSVAVSGWSVPAQFTTKPPPPNLVVGSFNIKDPDSSGGPAWGTRLPVIARDIQAGYLDVLGTQEAYEDNDREELLTKVNITGTRDYEMFPAFNVEAGWDNRILYQPARVTLLTTAPRGTYTYNAQEPGTDTDERRQLAYATFERSGRRFLFVTTHLAPGNEAVATQQWVELRYKILKSWNPNGYPVIVAGDFNSSKFGYEACKMLKPMQEAGFGDVLGQQCKSYTRSPVRVTSLISANVNSFNGFNPDISDYSVASGRVGNNVDWIFASNHLKVTRWRTHVTQSGGSLTYPIPSDHFMVSAIVLLP